MPKKKESTNHDADADFEKFKKEVEKDAHFAKSKADEAWKGLSKDNRSKISQSMKWGVGALATVGGFVLFGKILGFIGTIIFIVALLYIGWKMFQIYTSNTNVV